MYIVSPKEGRKRFDLLAHFGIRFPMVYTVFVGSVYPPAGILKFLRVSREMGIRNMNNALILPPKYYPAQPPDLPSRHPW